MNKCIFCGRLAKEPTKGLRTKEGRSMCVLFLRLITKDWRGKYVSDFIEVYCFGKLAEYAEKKMRRGTKLIAICAIHTVQLKLQPEHFISQCLS